MRAGARPAVWVSRQFGEQVGERGIGGLGKLPAQPEQQMVAPFGKIDDARREP